MTSNLTHHEHLKQFVTTDEARAVWHRVYAFHDKTIHQPTLARHIHQTTGIRLMAETNQDAARGEVSPETLHGFLTTSKMIPFATGVCSWCQESVSKGIPHTCVLITLYHEHIEETPEHHDTLAQALRSYHEGL